MPNLNFGIIGCGKIATRHANLLSMAEIDGAKLAAVCDPQKDRADAFAAEYGVKAYYDANEMAEDPNIDVLSILTPSGLHAKNIIDLAHHQKPIIVEKPMALRLKDADKAIEACDKYNVQLFVIKQNRYNLPVMALKKAIDSNRMGKLILGTIRLRWCRPQSYYDKESWRGTWEHDGGVLTNQASHHIDLLVWIMGEVESVFAKTTRALAKIEAEDTAVVTIRFKNGALGIIEATTATRPKDLEGSLSVLGENGSVVIGGFAANELQTWNFVEQISEDDSIYETHGSNPDHPYGYAHKMYYENAVQCILNGSKQLVDGLAGRKSLELISAIYESVETEKEVFLQFTPSKCRLGQPRKII
ncbi:Gfo/Idh/MocA family oxidoreductase [Verrucomicrobiales bacterium]|nr:Gfo/Idh/MocA family oxidoreductase [Verrucomicrobiales bacterium]